LPSLNPTWRLFGVLLIMAAVGCAPSAKADRNGWRPSAWVQLTGEGAQARATVVDGSCPQAVVDGQPRPMAVRRDGDGQFPTVCELTLPAGVKALSVGGQALPAPVAAPQRIVFLGDSGCRIQGLKVQACNDPKAWPFPEVARLAAAHKPDLVIHVGDYYYRENPCPPLNSACAGSPYGDNWGAWQAEFFQPAAPLLAAAPWVFVRGNHEVCNRGGGGWYALLDASSKLMACGGQTSPFTVNIGGLNLYVLDSSNTIDRAAPPWNVGQFSEQLQALGPALDQGKGWIVTHRPIWGLVPVARAPLLNPVEIGINFTEQAAVRGRRLEGVQMIVSGHIHDFAALSFGPGRPAQLVVGTGGDVGEAADIPRIRQGPRVVDGMDADFFTFDRFGYLLLDRQGEDWAGAFHDAQDHVVATCRLHERVLTCVRAPG
jgi:predicted phosphodiesterase